mmetsp:Transcript_25361/g.47174  ORF Transcript_25361/g.47174 Transcript_25361/m.47174 type:complete len:683 (-) Transcript_25361:175-2223(-)
MNSTELHDTSKQYGLLAGGTLGGRDEALASFSMSATPGNAGGGGGFALGGRLQQQSPRETALAAAMRSVRAAQRPGLSNMSNNTASSSSNSGLGPLGGVGGASSSSPATNFSAGGLNFTNELSARRSVLEVLAQHNAEAAAQQGPSTMAVSPATPSIANNKLMENCPPTPIAGPLELVKPKMQFGSMMGGGNTNNLSQHSGDFSSSMSMMGMVPSLPTMTPMMTPADMKMMTNRSSSPPISKKALLMKRACLEAESRPVKLPTKKKARMSLESTDLDFANAAAKAAADVVAAYGDNNAAVPSTAAEDDPSEGLVRVEAEETSAKLVPPSTEPITTYADYDVLSGRGGGTNVHPGNCRFRDLIHANRRRYLKAKKNDKPAISRSIVRSIRDAGGRFLRKDESTGLWYEIGDAGAREKTSQALRQRAPEMRKILFEDEVERDGMTRCAVVEQHQAVQQQQQQLLIQEQQMQLQKQQQQLQLLEHQRALAAAQRRREHRLSMATGNVVTGNMGTAIDKMDLKSQALTSLPQEHQVSPIPTNTNELRRLAQEQAAALSSLGASTQMDLQDHRLLNKLSQSPMPSTMAQHKQQQQQLHKTIQEPLALPQEELMKLQLQQQQQQKGGMSGVGGQMPSLGSSNQAKQDMLLQARLGMDSRAAYVQRNAQAWKTQTLLGRGINTFTPNIA